MELTKMLLFAQEGGEGAAAAGGMVMMLIQIAIVVVTIAGMWTTFAKAGKPGWAAIIPIYNIIVWLEIVGRPIWWIVLFLIPCVNIVIAAILSIDMAKSFGKGAGFGVGLWLLGFIFWPLLGFGDARYVGPAAAQS
ncbi:MAG: signal peptidase I [Pirellulaceae bacterium]|nr:signal peptidase I [Pirellulaceae bacterium]